MFKFLDNIIAQVNDVNDFGLVERSHEDIAWLDAFNQRNDTDQHQMDTGKIKREYRNYVING